MQQFIAHQVLVASDHFVFLRQTPEENIIVAANACREPVRAHFPLQAGGTRLLDLLNSGEQFPVHHGQAAFEIPSCWGRILRTACVVW